MIGTIGSLVQEASYRSRWLAATSMYAIGCVASSALLGVVLGLAGAPLRTELGPVEGKAVADACVGVLALAYAAADLRLLRMPRPHLIPAVPVAWWRTGRIYRASLAYGVALGLGFSTRIAFGGLYVLCAWCLLSGQPAIAALLMGTYGGFRSLAMFPISWLLVRRSRHVAGWLSCPIFAVDDARACAAVALSAMAASSLCQTVELIAR